MASEQLVYNIDEQFCQCAICLQPFSDPKGLPCLHRFCKECLSPLFVKLNVGDIFCCPLCRASLTVTEGGVEDIKNDFLVSELTKAIQLQKSLQSQNQIRRCKGCSKEEESVGFCSKCGGFLCQNCFTLHQTLKTAMLKDHQPVIDLKDVISGKVKIGMENLSQFTKAPRCENHPENILRLSCATCNGQQICFACTFEDHEEHKAESIRNIAGIQRDDFQKKLDKLRLMVTNWENSFEKLTMIREKLSSAVTEIRGRVSSITEKKLKMLKADRENVTLATETKVKELKESSVTEKTRLEAEKNEKIKEIERQYDELLKKYNTDTNDKIEVEIEDGNKRKDEIEKQITQLKTHSDEMIKVVSKQVHYQNLGLDWLMSDLSNTQKRFENYITTGSSVLSLANDWSAVENIPSLLFAFDGIKDEVEKIKAGLSELEVESNLPIPIVTESTKPEEIGFIERQYLELIRPDVTFEYVNQMVFLESNGCIAMSGKAGKHSAAVIKFTMAGRKQKYLKCFNECSYENQFCSICQIDEDMIATACDKSVGIINVKKSTYNEVLVEGDECLTCICADNTLKQILTHQSDDNIVKVFDLDLKLVKTRKLPHTPSHVVMVVHDDKLIIGCCRTGDDEIYVLNKKDEPVTVIPPPGLQKVEGEVWKCWDLCSSADGTLYVLWHPSEESNTIDSGCTVVYTPTYYPLEMIRTNTAASCLALMGKDGTKTVIAATNPTLYICKMSWW